MFNSFRTLALAAVAATGLTTLPAAAATLTYATAVEDFSQGLDALGNPVSALRSDPTAALGAPDGAFVALGFGGSITLSFGTLFGSPGAVIEITNLSRDTYIETADVFGITEGGMEVLLASITNATATTEIFFAGIYAAMKIVDTTTDLFPTIGSVRDGFDLDAVGVTAIPLPAGGLLLIGALGGLVVLRRRNAA
jgi:hypothetical protein